MPASILIYIPLHHKLFSFFFFLMAWCVHKTFTNRTLTAQWNFPPKIDRTQAQNLCAVIYDAHLKGTRVGIVSKGGSERKMSNPFCVYCAIPIHNHFTEIRGCNFCIGFPMLNAFLLPFVEMEHFSNPNLKKKEKIFPTS